MTTKFRSSHQCEAAVTLAYAGYSVFPCRARGKAPLTPNGFKAATREERQILQWWDRWPNANIGVACEASGVTVVDIDPKAGADPMIGLRRLEGETVVAWTGVAPQANEEYPDSLNGCRGAHVWYRGLAKTGRTSWPGIEIRARGAYVIAPPSLHPSGVAYEWRGGGHVPVGRLPALPSGLLDGGEQRGGGEDWSQPVDPTEPLTVTQRHEGLKHIAGTLLARRVYEPDLIAGALLEANRVRCRPPKSEAEVRKIAEWAADCEEAKIGRADQKWAQRVFDTWDMPQEGNTRDP